MRHLLGAALTLCLAAETAQAWEAGVEGRICTLTHVAGAQSVRLTYDPAGPLYTITVTRADPWPEAPVFAIAFRGGREAMIQTTRHTLSEGGRSLSVADQGFGNVLNGLAMNRTAVMGSGDAVAVVSLAGAAPEVEVFRACGTVPAV